MTSPMYYLVQNLLSHVFHLSVIMPLHPFAPFSLKFIEFTNCHDKFLEIAIQCKQDKYAPAPFMTTIATHRWSVQPLIIINARQQYGIYKDGSIILSAQFKLPPP